MLWYQRSPGDTAMKLIGYVEYSQIYYEELYKEHFNITGDLSGNKAKNGSLFIVDLRESEHSAVYYCAARYAHWGRSALNNTKTKHCSLSTVVDTSCPSLWSTKHSRDRSWFFIFNMTPPRLITSIITVFWIKGIIPSLRHFYSFIPKWIFTGPSSEELRCYIYVHFHWLLISYCCFPWNLFQVH